MRFFRWLWGMEEVRAMAGTLLIVLVMVSVVVLLTNLMISTYDATTYDATCYSGGTVVWEGQVEQHLNGSRSVETGNIVQLDSLDCVYERIGRSIK